MVGRKEARAACKAATPPTSKAQRPLSYAREGKKNPPSEARDGPAKRVRSPRVPRAAAVTIPPEVVETGVRHEEAMLRVKEVIKLQHLGIDTGLRPRRSINGGFIWEVPGSNGRELARWLNK